MSEIRKLPIGVQDFESLRLEKNIYIDKTAYIYQLLTTDAPYFLSRPRRFGKSLFLSTLKAYFFGKKELFEGLAIGELEKDWTQYPIIYIDLNLATYQSTDNLYNVLDEILKEHEQEWEVTSITKELSLRFGNLIQAARKRAGQRVVVLADEYDKPLLDTLQNEPLNRSLRQMLRGFYGIIKSANADLRFAFLTGITKFSKVGVFSELNHLADISFDNECAGLCGISETELTKNYLIPYESDRRTFVKIGVEFCDEERTVKRWILA